MNVVSTFDGKDETGEQKHHRKDAEMEEVRTGRVIMRRRVVLSGGSPEPTKKSANILFIHGSCAASTQWDRLIDELKSIFLGNNNNGQDSSIGGELSSSIDGTIECFLFDQLGCGESKHPADDWAAYSASELLMDLESIARSILRNDESVPLFLVAHSYGVSQAIQLINNLSSAEAVRVKGVVFIAGALNGGPSLVVNPHWIFRLPVSVLRLMQPMLSRTFVNLAIFDKELRESAIEISNRNEMAMCKAFYRQQKYATVEEAKKIKNAALVIHGKEDMIISVDAGYHLHQTLSKSDVSVIPDASHQVFEEKYAEVAEVMWGFICSQIAA